MTDTINNVPRELIQLAAELLGQASQYSGDSEAYAAADLNALLSAPSPAGVYSADPLACPGCASGCFRCASPAGVDGLEVVAWLSSETVEAVIPGAGYELLLLEGRNLEPLCRLSDAQATIDGLRGEVERFTGLWELELARAQKAENDAAHFALTIDQQAQRIGELASHLEFAVTMLTVAGLAGNAQVEAMRAALSAGVGRVK